MIINYCGDNLMSSIGVRDGVPYLGFIKRADVPADLLAKADADRPLDDGERARIVDAVADSGVMIRMDEPGAAIAMLNLMSMLRNLIMAPFEREVEEEAPVKPVHIH
jgi:hypothetical protein